MREIDDPDFSGAGWRAAPEMTPREFLVHVVSPNLDQLRTDAGSLRHAHNAVLATDALMGCVYQWLGQIRPAVLPQGCESDDLYRDALARRDRACHVHRDLAAALKHGQLDRGKKPRLVRSSGAMGARRSGWGNAMWDVDAWDGDFLVIVHTNDDEPNRSALEIVTRTVEVIETELQKHGG